MTSHLSRLLVAVVLACAGAATARAQHLPEGPPLSVWGPNGFVHALARVGNTLFVGGEFDYVGPPTGAFVTIDANDASAVSAPTFVLGPVQVMTADGAGGWFVVPAPPFGSQASPEIVHLLADGTRDPAWTPPVIGIGTQRWISSLVVDGGRLLVGGEFTSVNGAARTGIAALELAGGALLPWTLQLDAPPGLSLGARIGPLTADRLYVSGNFTAVNGTSRDGVAAVDPASGAVLPFALPVGTRPVLAGATESAVYGWCQQLIALCAFDLAGAPLAGWSPPALANVTGVVVTPAAIFTSIAEQNLWRLVSLDPSTGARRPWGDPVFAGGPPGLSVAGGRIYAAGDFTAVNGVPRSRVAALDETTGTLQPWAPTVGGIVYAISVQGQRVAVAGGFNSAGGVSHRNLVALDLATGRPRPTPAPDFAVRALHAVRGVVVAAGGKGTAGRATAFEAASGNALQWGLSTDAAIDGLASSDRYLFLGGSFRSVEGQPRNGLAAVDLTTAALAPLNQSSVWNVGALAVHNGTVYASGYVPIPGHSLPVVVALDGNSLSRRPFTPSPAPGATSGFAFAPGRVLLAGTMSAGPRQAGWFDVNSGQWAPRVSAQDFVGMRATQAGSMIVVAGNVHPGLRVAVEVIDGDTGAGVPWDPGLVDGQFANITAMHASDDYLVLGGSFDAAAGVPVANIAVFRMPRAGAPRRLTSAVVGHTVTLGWQPGPAPAAQVFIVEAGTAPGSANVGRFNVGPATSVAGTLGAGRYFVRVRGVGAAGEGPASNDAAVDVPAIAAPPEAPGTLAASVSGTTVSLAWGLATGNATTYVIEAGSASGLSNLVTFPTGNLDTALVTAAPPGRYYVRVRAANASGPGPASNEVVIDVP